MAKKIVYRLRGFCRDDWACPMHPTSDWKVVDELEFNRIKHSLLDPEYEEKSSSLEIEWHYAEDDLSRYLARGWIEIKRADSIIKNEE